MCWAHTKNRNHSAGIDQVDLKMSLEKFQATDASRDLLKNHLLTKRKPIVPAVPLVPHRLSFELSEDLQVIIKKPPSGGDRKMPRVRNPDENKENAEERFHYNTPTKAKFLHKVDATMMEEPNDVFQITNTSFETLEDMCEKTASDPDSTLFRYLNHDPPPVMQTRDAILRRNQSYDEEANALQRLLDELNVEETEKRMRNTSPNDTQLDDIEEPSKFWENTLTADAIQSISPVKMVGLMRQSTIMEEYSDVSESEASSTSYQSAMKTGWSSETTGCYDTANDTATCSEQEAGKKVSINSSTGSSSSDLFQQRHSRQKFFEYQREDDRKSLHLIDLETTIQLNSPDSFPDSPESPEPEEIPNCSPDSFEESNKLTEQNFSPESTELSEPELYECSPEISKLTESEITNNSSVIELSDDESAECDKILQKIDQLEADSALNRSFTIKSEKKEDDTEEKSIHFNDTMEEVEYMMKKGMQYMEAAKDKHPPLKSHLTPAKTAERYRSPSPMLSSPITPKTVIAKPKPVNNHTLNIKPFPKLDIFKKPNASNLRPPTVQNKFISATKKQQYAHVISPIGAYINKTPVTPLISNIKPISSDSTVTSKAFKQLEYNSRVTPKKVVPTISEQKDYVCSLPKKAYISAEYQHITDKRTHRVIPGGPKIQCYIQPALVPAVVRHEGKLKMRTSSVEPPSPRRTDDSLAGLSMISGDVSVYTIKDAQKF